ncbi:hypothetical protein EJ04DRAFT_71110 [Polyplosphaeria fusca]|uniref:Uncharacterized protein n=1 Tax=Polyplosphaeria fusca TaxID=682080 RepID=A0A9P4V4W0_9PLEO|nr:hypothetical protein EJ04DRAFT_71110 [Polyplosphaeria fusca]
MIRRNIRGGRRKNQQHRSRTLRSCSFPCPCCSTLDVGMGSLEVPLGGDWRDTARAAPSALGQRLRGPGRRPEWAASGRWCAAKQPASPFCFTALGLAVRDGPPEGPPQRATTTLTTGCFWHGWRAPSGSRCTTRPLITADQEALSSDHGAPLQASRTKGNCSHRSHIRRALPAVFLCECGSCQGPRRRSRWSRRLPPLSAAALRRRAVFQKQHFPGAGRTTRR